MKCERLRHAIRLSTRTLFSGDLKKKKFLVAFAIYPPFIIARFLKFFTYNSNILPWPNNVSNWILYHFFTQIQTKNEHALLTRWCSLPTVEEHWMIWSKRADALLNYIIYYILFFLYFFFFFFSFLLYFLKFFFILFIFVRLLLNRFSFRGRPPLVLVFYPFVLQ